MGGNRKVMPNYRPQAVIWGSGISEKPGKRIEKQIPISPQWDPSSWGSKEITLALF